MLIYVTHFYIFYILFYTFYLIIYPCQIRIRTWLYSYISVLCFWFCCDGTESWPLKSLHSNMRETGARPLNIMICKYAQLLWYQCILVLGICHWNRLKLIIFPIPHWMIWWSKGNHIKVWSDLCSRLVVCMSWTFIVKDWHLERDSFIRIWSLLNCRFWFWNLFFVCVLMEAFLMFKSPD